MALTDVSTAQLAQRASFAPADRIIRLEVVLYLTGLSRTTIWRLQRAGKFPKSRKLSARAVGWLESEITGWMARAGGSSC